MLASRFRIVLLLLFFSLTFIARADAEQMLTTWYACPYSDCVANRHYPKGTVLELFNPRTGKSAHAVVRDYGPEAWTGRSLDVSRQIAWSLGMIRDGVVTLEVRVISRP